VNRRSWHEDGVSLVAGIHGRLHFWRGDDLHTGSSDRVELKRNGIVEFKPLEDELTSSCLHFVSSCTFFAFSSASSRCNALFLALSLASSLVALMLGLPSGRMKRPVDIGLKR